MLSASTTHPNYFAFIGLGKSNWIITKYRLGFLDEKYGVWPGLLCNGDKAVSFHLRAFEAHCPVQASHLLDATARTHQPLRLPLRTNPKCFRRIDNRQRLQFNPVLLLPAGVAQASRRLHGRDAHTATPITLTDDFLTSRRANHGRVVPELPNCVLDEQHSVEGSRLPTAATSRRPGRPRSWRRWRARV